MSSIFTPPGTNAAQGQENTDQSAQNTSLGMLNAYAPLFNSQTALQSSQLPTAQNAITGLGQFTNQSGRNQMSSSFLQNARGQAQTAAAETPGQFAGNPALAQAYGLRAYNGANQSANQYAQQINSPQGEASAYNSYLGGLQSQAPNAQTASELTQGVYGSPKVQVGQGLWGTLASLAGPAATMYSASNQ